MNMERDPLGRHTKWDRGSITRYNPTTFIHLYKWGVMHRPRTVQGRAVQRIKNRAASIQIERWSVLNCLDHGVERGWCCWNREKPWKVTGKRGVKAIFSKDASTHRVTSVVVWTKIRYKDWRYPLVELPYCSYNKRRQKRSCYNNRLFAPILNMAPRISIVRGSVTYLGYANTPGWCGEGVTFFNVLLKERVIIPATGQSWRSKGCC